LFPHNYQLTTLINLLFLQYLQQYTAHNSAYKIIHHTVHTAHTDYTSYINCSSQNIRWCPDWPQTCSISSAFGVHSWLI